MTRSDLVRILARKSRIELVRAELIVEAVFQGFMAAMHRGERIEIRGLGSFHMRSYRGYLGRNPKTGAPIEVEPKRLPYFKPSKAFSGGLNDAAAKAVPLQTGPGHPLMATKVAGNPRSTRDSV